MKAGWKQVALGSIAQVGAGNSAPQGDELFTHGTYPFFRTSDAGRIRFGDIKESSDYLNDLGITGLRRFPTGTILFPKSGASTFLNHRVMLAVDGYVSSHLATIVGDETKVNRRFLLYFLSTIVAQNLIQDHAYPSLNLPMIASIPVMLPPLPEQQRIVALLDAAFAGIATAQAHTEQNLRNARELFESQLAAVFSQRGAGWETSTLETTCEMYQPKTISTKEMVEDGAYPVFGANGEIGRYDKFNHETPQLLVTCRGATCGAINISKPFSWITGNAMVVRPKTASLSTDFLELALRGGIDVATAITGSAQPQITRTNLNPLEISYPITLDEQNTVVKRLNALRTQSQTLQSLAQRKLAALDELKQSLLQQAFSGQL